MKNQSTWYDGIINGVGHAMFTFGFSTLGGLLGVVLDFAKRSHICLRIMQMFLHA